MNSPRIRQAGAAALVLVATLTGCGREVLPKSEPPRPVRSVEVHTRPTSLTLALPADLRPRIEARVGFRVGGKIAERLVSAGERVVAGQPLARLDPQDVAPAIAAAQAALTGAKADAVLAEAEAARALDLRRRNFVSQASLERQQAAEEAARARVRAAEAQLAQARNTADFQLLRADAPGVIVGVDAEVGQVVAAGQPVFRIARAGDLEALVNVPEREMTTARSRSNWRVTVPAVGDRVLSARVREISPAADPASRTWAMRLALEGDLAGLELGMTATAEAVLASTSAISVPISALFSTDERPRVWVVDRASSTVRSVPVKTGGLSGDTVSILEGLSDGDRVVTAGASLLKEGAKVRLLGETVAQ